MRHGHQDLNVNITFRSCRPLDGRQATIFENFPIRHIFLKFCFFKYKNEKRPMRVRLICEIQWAPNNPTKQPKDYKLFFFGNASSFLFAVNTPRVSLETSDKKWRQTYTCFYAENIIRLTDPTICRKDVSGLAPLMDCHSYLHKSGLPSSRTPYRRQGHQIPYHDLDSRVRFF